MLLAPGRPQSDGSFSAVGGGTTEFAGRDIDEALRTGIIAILVLSSSPPCIPCRAERPKMIDQGSNTPYWGHRHSVIVRTEGEALPTSFNRARFAPTLVRPGPRRPPEPSR